MANRLALLERDSVPKHFTALTPKQWHGGILRPADYRGNPHGAKQQGGIKETGMGSAHKQSRIFRVGRLTYHSNVMESTKEEDEAGTQPDWHTQHPETSES